MKTGNIISAGLSIFLLAGALVCDVLLAEQYRNTDLSDPYRNFETVPVKKFRKLSVSGGNGYAIHLRAGKDFSIRLMKSRKSFFALNHSGDSLSLGFRVANQTYQKAENCIVGLIVTAPAFSHLKISGVNSILSGFTADSMMIQLDSAAGLRCRDLKIGKLLIEVGRSSSIDFQKLNEADLLSLTLTTHASATMNGITYKKFENTVSDSATIRFYDNSLDKLLNTLSAGR